MTDGLYGDTEALVVGWLIPRYTDSRVCTELPATLPAKTIQITRIGGAPQTFPYELPRIDVDVYCPDRGSASLLARQVKHDLLFDLPGYLADDGTRVVSVRCDSGPFWVPYDNTTVRRMTAAYELRTHNPI